MLQVQVDSIWIFLLQHFLIVQIALPHVNLLSKVDLVEKFGRLQFGLDYYTEVSFFDALNMDQSNTFYDLDT